MALRRCVIPLTAAIKQLERSKIQTGHLQNVLFKQNFCKNTLVSSIQVRKFMKDSSKAEVPEDRIRVYYGVLTPQIRAVKVRFYQN